MSVYVFSAERHTLMEIYVNVYKFNLHSIYTNK